MSLKVRLSKVEQYLIPKEQVQIRVILRGPDDPEPEDEPGVQMIRVRLDAAEDFGAEGKPGR